MYMEGWVDMDEWRDGQMKRQMDRGTDGWLEGRTHRQMDERTDGGTGGYGWMQGWRDG